MLSYRKQDSYHWLQFPGLADFRISEEATEISCYPVAEIPVETIRHLLLDQVLPRCLTHQGKIMLHASAVQLERGILLFLGDSRAGKSTLAGHFHQTGAPALSDDCVWVRESQVLITAVPSYSGLRLWEDSLEALFASEKDIQSMAHYSSKKRVPLNQNEMPRLGSSLPILAVILLVSPARESISEVILDQLSRQEAFIAMMKQSFRLDVSDLRRISEYMQVLGRIIPRLPLFRLSMPRDFALLPTVRQKILEKVL